MDITGLHEFAFHKVGGVLDRNFDGHGIFELRRSGWISRTGDQEGSHMLGGFGWLCFALARNPDPGTVVAVGLYARQVDNIDFVKNTKASAHGHLNLGACREDALCKTKKTLEAFAIRIILELVICRFVFQSRSID
jgi:hypothetical protein